MTKKQKILTSIFILIGVAVIVFFGMRAVRSFVRIRGNGNFGKPPPAKQTDLDLIRDWMTVPYIARMYDVPPEALFKSLDLDKNTFDKDADKNYGKMSLKELNDKLYPNEEGIILAHVKASIQAMQKQEQPPQFPATPLPYVSPTTTP